MIFYYKLYIYKKIFLNLFQIFFFLPQGIQWKPIEFFNNKIVCDLIESKRPPGIFSVLDDTVATMSAVSDGADTDFRNKMTAQVL